MIMLKPVCKQTDIYASSENYCYTYLTHWSRQCLVSLDWYKYAHTAMEQNTCNKSLTIVTNGEVSSETWGRKNIILLIWGLREERDVRETAH